jgi:hypothetical protein
MARHLYQKPTPGGDTLAPTPMPRAEGWAIIHKKIQRPRPAEGLRGPLRRRRKRRGTSAGEAPLSAQ